MPSGAAALSLALPTMTREQAAQANVFAATRPLPPVAGLPLRSVPAPVLGRQAQAVALTFPGGARGRLLAPPAAWQAVLDSLDPAASGAEGVWRVLLLEAALADALEQLGGACPDLRVTCAQETEAASLPCALGLELAGHAMRLELEPAPAGAAARALAGVPPARATPAGLVLPVHVRALAATLGLAQLRAAEPGSVILARGPDFGGVCLVADERLIWHGQVDGGRLRVGRRERQPDVLMERMWMDDAALTDESAPDLQDLPVRLSFELARLELSLAELQAIGPGTVFELGRAEPEAVDIVANGRRIGAGRIVMVAGVPGVQITRLGPK